MYLDHLCELQHTLMDDDCFLPHFKREISALCLQTPIFGGDDSLRTGEDRANVIYGTETCGTMIENGTAVTYTFDGYEAVKSVHIVFDSDLERDTLEGHWCERKHVTRANILLDSPMMYTPKTLCRSFTLTAETEDGEITLLSVQNNLKRAYHADIDKPIRALKLTVLANWGGTAQTPVISFDFH